MKNNVPYRSQTIETSHYIV